MRCRYALLFAFAGLVAGLVLGGGRAVDAQAGGVGRASLFGHLDLFAEVLAHVHRSYVDDVDQERLIRGAVRGVMAELDPHSVWLTPAELEAMRADTRGEYVGVGMEIRLDEGGRIRVEAVSPHGPAAEAGIQAGDVLLQVDDVPMAGRGVGEAVQLLRGPRGVPVVLRVQRLAEHAGAGPNGPAQPRIETVAVIRDVIRVQAVEERLLDAGVGHIRVRSFQQNTAQEVGAALGRLEGERGSALRGLVLDLRGNRGGLLREGILLADLFLDNGVIVSTRARSDRENERWAARRSATRYRGPMILLVDAMSASASEIVAGALQDHERALVMGERTFGKGSVQSIVTLADGSGLKLTVSLYLTPSGRSIQDQGITPDVVVSRRPAQAGDGGDAGDAQLESALQQLALFERFGRGAGR